MKQQTPLLRRATGLLLAAAALPLTPLAAQETQTAPDTPVVDQAPPATAEPAPTTTEPVAVTPTAPAPVATSPAPAETTPTQATTVRRTAPVRTTTATRNTVRTARPAPVAAPAPAPAVEAPAPAATAPETLPAPEVLPAPEALPVTTSPQPAQAQERNGSILPWLLGGLLVLGALAFLLMRRRRRDAIVYDEVYEPAPVVEPEPEPVMAAPLAAAPVETVAAETGRPWLDLELRPARAGVTGQEAQVEFELIVRNNGSAVARDVHVSTWMVAGGATPESEMERLLIERPPEAEAGESSLPAVEIEAGATKRIETAVALSTAGLETDAVLPVVVAEATYTLPDRSEGRTSARYAVSVPFGEELSHFDIENPSGLHEGVEAWPLGEVERA